MTRGLQFRLKKTEKHCAFCYKNHAVNNCPEIAVRSKTADVFKVSTVAPLEVEKIKNRMSLTMPVTAAGKGGVHSTLSKKLLCANFVIHQACVAHGMRNDVVEGLNYLVTFLNHKGQPDMDNNGERVWIDGNVMAMMVNTTNQKTKYIFDETVIPKAGWTIRTQSLSQPFDQMYSQGSTNQQG